MPRTKAPETRLHGLRLFASAFEIFAVNWRLVLPVAIVATLIPAAVEIFIAHELPKVVAGLLTSAVDTLSVAVASGAAEQLVHRWEDGERRVPLKGVVSRVPPSIVPLILVALVQAAIVAVGLLLLLIPGFIAWTYFALVGPAVVAERPGVRGAFKRSATLVRGNAWRVFAVVFFLALLAGFIGFGIENLFESLGASAENPVSLAIGEGITFPLEVLVTAVMYWRLREIEARRPQVEEADEGKEADEGQPGDEREKSQQAEAEAQ
jgi:hypothetical protein